MNMDLVMWITNDVFVDINTISLLNINTIVLWKMLHFNMFFDKEVWIFINQRGLQDISLKIFSSLWRSSYRISTEVMLGNIFVL